MMLKHIIIIMILWTNGASTHTEGPKAEVTAKEKCPVVLPIKNFNISAFASGTWYEIARYPDHWEREGDCSMLMFLNDGTKNFKLASISENRPNIVNGYVAFAPNVGTDAIINFHSTSFIDAEDSVDIPAYYFAIDYNKYAIGYECYINEKTKIRHDYTWILSRTVQFDSETKKKVDNIIEASKFIDKTKLIWEHDTKENCKILN